MPDAVYACNTYSSVNSIALELMDFSEKELSEVLEQEFDINFYPLESEPANKLERDSINEYMKTGFGLSALLAENYRGPQDSFFMNREKNFRDFEEELGDYGNTFKGKHYIQYVNLYGEIMDEKDFEQGVTSNQMVLMNNSEKQEAALELLQDFEQKLSEDVLEEGLA